MLKTAAIVPISTDDRQTINRGKSRQKSRITNGALLPGYGRSAWVRRCKDVIAAHLSDIPDPSAAERSIIRRASVLTVELERMEVLFATAGEASAEDLDTYSRVSANLRRLLESVGLQRRAKVVGPSLGDLIRQDQQAERDRLAHERAAKQVIDADG